MAGGRPAGPLKIYTVEFVWPSSPGRYREAVVSVDEKTARRSATALHSMHCAFQVRITFTRANREYLYTCVAAQWNRIGNVTYQDSGEFSQYIPGWVTGKEPLAEEAKNDHTVLAGS